MPIFSGRFLKRIRKKETSQYDILNGANCPILWGWFHQVALQIQDKCEKNILWIHFIQTTLIYLSEDMS